MGGELWAFFSRVREGVLPVDTGNIFLSTLKNDIIFSLAIAFQNPFEIVLSFYIIVWFLFFKKLFLITLNLFINEWKKILDLD